MASGIVQPAIKWPTFGTDTTLFGRMLVLILRNDTKECGSGLTASMLYDVYLELKTDIRSIFHPMYVPKWKNCRHVVNLLN